MVNWLEAPGARENERQGSFASLRITKVLSEEGPASLRGSMELNGSDAMMVQGTGSMPPGLSGWHLAMRLRASEPPRSQP